MRPGHDTGKRTRLCGRWLTAVASEHVQYDVRVHERVEDRSLACLCLCLWLDLSRVRLSSELKTTRVSSFPLVCDRNENGREEISCDACRLDARRDSLSLCHTHTHTHTHTHILCVLLAVCELLARRAVPLIGLFDGALFRARTICTEYSSSSAPQCCGRANVLIRRASLSSSSYDVYAVYSYFAFLADAYPLRIACICARGILIFVSRRSRSDFRAS